MVFRKIEFLKPKPKETVKDSNKEYILAQVNKTEVKRKIEAGKAYAWVEDGSAKMDVHSWVQMIMETTDGVKIAANLSDEAVENLCWLARRWQNAVYHDNKLLAEALEEDLMEAYTEYRLGGGIRKDQLGPEMVIPPPQLNPAFNQFNRRPTSTMMPAPES